MTTSLDQIISTLQKAGPALTETALATARIAATRNLVIGFISLGLELALVCFVIKVWKGKETELEIIIGACFVAFVVSILLVGFLLDPFDWIGLFWPDIFIAHQWIK